jgi:hypothetical protein
MLRFRNPILPVYSEIIKQNKYEPEDYILINYLNSIYIFTFIGFAFSLSVSFILGYYFVNFTLNYLIIMVLNAILSIYLIKSIKSAQSMTIPNNKEKIPKDKVIKYFIFCGLYPLIFLPGISYIIHHNNYHLFFPILIFNTIGNLFGSLINLYTNINSIELVKESAFTSFIGGVFSGLTFTLIFSGFNYTNIFFWLISNIFISLVTYVNTEKGLLDFSKENLDSIDVAMSIIFDCFYPSS